MMNAMVRNWWMLALRGLFAMIFGLMAVIWPHITVGVLVALFGAYSLVDGVFALIAAMQHRERALPLVFHGVAGIAAGVVTFVWPGITALALLYVIAAWAIVTGVMEIAAAIKLREQLPGELLLVLSGICSIAFGVLMMIWPGTGALALVGLIAAYAIVFGVLTLWLSFRLHALHRPSAANLSDSAGLRA